jgi:hypothetical protein
MKEKNLEEFIAALHQIENEIDINNFKVGGIDFWPLIRTSIWMNYRQSYLSAKNKSFRVVENDFIHKLSVFFRSFFTGNLFYLFGSRKLQRANVLFFGDVSSLRVASYVQGCYSDYFFDPLIENFKGNRSVFIIRQNFAFLRPIKGLHNYYIMGFDFLRYSFRSLFISEKRIISAEFILEYNKLVFNSGYLKDFIPSIKYLFRHIRITHSFSRLMLKYLKQVDPKIVFLTHYNSHLSTSIIYTSKLLGIPVVDVQHGVINHLHPSYSYLNQNVFKLNSVPNAFLLNDKRSYEILAKWVPLKRIYVMTKVRVAPIEASRFNLESSIFGSIEKMASKRKLVLITLSWENGINDLLLDVVNKSIGIAYFMFRLHPSTSLMEEKELRKIIRNQIYTDNYHIHCAKELNLEFILEKIDLHVTECSTVVLEALKFRRKSIVISQIGLEYYNDLLQSGVLMYAPSSLELLNYLNDETTYGLHSSLLDFDSGPGNNFDLFINGLEQAE